MENIAGKVIKSYELSELIDMGGFGAVYRARQTAVDREVAVKIIYPAFANRPSFIRQFETEAQLVASLEHPHIVPLYDYWRDPDGAYIVMRWLRGGHLRRAMDETDGPQEMVRVFQMLTQIASALTFAHRYGVVHRDLKPENILMDEAGNYYLADFGIARMLSDKEDTDDFAAMGSPAYAAPEQITGAPTSPRTDIYSLGILLYELMTGQHPFPDLEDFTITELSRKRAVMLVPSIHMLRPDLPRDLDAVIQRATAVNPSDRFPDITSMVHAFRQAAFQSDGRDLSMGGLAEVGMLSIDRLEQMPNPYRGLRAFQESDASNFFGRRALVRQLMNRMGETGSYARFLSIVGPSGSGKSSVVKAGLIPALKRGGLPGSANWFYTEMVPGTDPFKELGTALTSIAIHPVPNLQAQLEASAAGLTEVIRQILPADDNDVELLLFIDQFEEIFTLTTSEHLTSRFLESLHQAISSLASRLRVVITLRADFYDRPLLRPLVSTLMSRRTEVVIPLSEQELEQAIIEPARRAGVMLEAGLSSAIINEVSQQTGTLPLLQYLMSELFEQRDGRTLTLESYRRMGGVRGALARRADELYLSMTPAQQEATRQIFLRLITLGEGTEDTRRRALIAELTSISTDETTLRATIDLLGKSRLLTFDRDPVTRSPTLEVTHEAIIREWQRLRGWLDVSRTDVRMQRNLAVLAHDWLNAKRDASFMLRGVRLEQYEQWVTETSIALTREEREFIDASMTAREQEEAATRARQEREELLERRARDRLRILVAVLAVATLLAFGLSGFALVERNRADAQSLQSRSQAQAASALRVLGEGDTDLATVLAMAASDINDPSSLVGRTLAEIAFSPGTVRIFEGHTAPVLTVDITTDGTRLISGSFDGTVRLWDTATGNQIGEALRGHRADIQVVGFSPDGLLAASGALDNTAIMWSVTTGQEVLRLTTHTEPIRALTFTPDSARLLTGSDDRQIIVWDVATGQEVLRLVDAANGHVASLLALDVSPDGRYVLSGAGNGDVILWDLATGSVLRHIKAHSTAVRALDFSPDGQTAVSSSTDQSLVVWDVSGGDLVQVQRFTGFEDAITGVVFLPESQRVLVSLKRGTLEIRDVHTGERLVNLKGHTQEPRVNAKVIDGQTVKVEGVDINQVRISADGRLAVTGSRDLTLRLWEIGNAALLYTATPHQARIAGVGFNRDGAVLYTASADGTVRAADRATGEEIGRLTLPPGEQVTALAIHPDGRTLLIGTEAGLIRTWMPASDEQGVAFARHTPDSAILAISLNADGTQGVSSSEDGAVLLWDYASGTIIRSLEGHTSDASTVDFAPDGRHILTGSRDNTVIWWDTATGAPVYTLTAHEQPVWSVDISPDGQRAVSASQDSRIILWDLTTGTERTRLSGHTGGVWSVRFSPDGRWLLSGSQDGDMILWDVATGQELQRFPAAEQASVFHVAFSPDADYAIGGEEGGSIQLWRIFDLGELVPWMQQNRYVRQPECPERLIYQIEPYCS